MHISTHVLLFVLILFLAQCCKKRVSAKLRCRPVTESKSKSSPVQCEMVNDESDENSIESLHGIPAILEELSARVMSENSVEIMENIEVEVVDNHVNMEGRKWIRNKFATVINPFKDFKTLHTNVNSFKSVWLKCAACLAIANNINSTFSDFYEKNSELPPNEFNAGLKEELEGTCRNGFKNYDLREYQGNVVIARSSVYSNHVPSKLDGEWTKVLTELCLNYVRNLNFNRLISQHLSGCLQFDDFFCRSEGLYRDCNNLGLEYLQVPEYQGTVTLSFCIKPR